MSDRHDEKAPLHNDGHVGAAARRDPGVHAGGALTRALTPPEAPMSSASSSVEPPPSAPPGVPPGDWRAMGPRPVATLVIHAPAGSGVQHFPSGPPAPQATRLSVLDRAWRARPAPQAPPSPDELAEGVSAAPSPVLLETVRAREGRSILHRSATRERVPFDGVLREPVRVADPTPVRTWATPVLTRRESTRARSALDPAPAELDPQRSASVLCSRERP